jgi:hypothetical protein
MTLEKQNLIAPNSLKIVGLKLENGSLVNFEYTYDAQTNSCIYKLTDGTAIPVGRSVLIDTEGNEWDLNDVEWHSLTSNL